MEALFAILFVNDCRWLMMIRVTCSEITIRVCPDMWKSPQFTAIWMGKEIINHINYINHGCLGLYILFLDKQPKQQRELGNTMFKRPSRIWTPHEKPLASNPINRIWHMLCSHLILKFGTICAIWQNMTLHCPECTRVGKCWSPGIFCVKAWGAGKICAKSVPSGNIIGIDLGPSHAVHIPRPSTEIPVSNLRFWN